MLLVTSDEKRETYIVLYLSRARVCVCLIMCDLDTSKRGNVGRIWAVAPQKKKLEETVGSYSKQRWTPYCTIHTLFSNYSTV
jgi:hypothetical protein